MADTSRIVDRVAARFVKQLTDPIEAALQRGGQRLSGLEAALHRGEAAALRIVDHAVQDADLRVLATKRPMEERLLDVAEESANATRCSVRPTGTGRPAAAATDTVLQQANEASAQAVQGLVGPDTVRLTDDIKRAIETTPLANPQQVGGLLPNERAIRRALDEASSGATFSSTGAKAKPMRIADLIPSEQLEATSELVVRYRAGLPTDPIVVNAKGVILDGHHRAASAWAAGRDRIFVVQVRGNDEVGRAVEWLRWNN